MAWIFTWGGRCFGYREDDNLWTHNGRHVGKFSSDEVYGPDGAYLGELKSGKLITKTSKKGQRGPRFTPSMNRVGRVPSIGHVGTVMTVGYEDFPELEA